MDAPWYPPIKLKDRPNAYRRMWFITHSGIFPLTTAIFRCRISRPVQPSRLIYHQTTSPRKSVTCHRLPRSPPPLLPPLSDVTVRPIDRRRRRRRRRAGSVLLALAAAGTGSLPGRPPCLARAGVDRSGPSDERPDSSENVLAGVTFTELCRPLSNQRTGGGGVTRRRDGLSGRGARQAGRHVSVALAVVSTRPRSPPPATEALNKHYGHPGHSPAGSHTLNSEHYLTRPIVSSSAVVRSPSLP